MGIMPLFGITMIFFYTILHFTNFIVNHGKVLADLGYWMDYCLTMFTNMLMSIILGLLSTDSELYLKIITWITDSENNQNLLFQSSAYYNQEKSDLLNYLQALTNNPIQHNACDMFLIDRKFLLSFIGTLIPFCVMLIQMYQA